MNSAIEFHDSDCLAIESESDGNGSVILDAYVHRTEGKPGVSSGEGGMQKVRIRMASMRITGESGPLPALIYDGSLKVGTELLDNVVPLPSEYFQDCNLRIIFRDDARILFISGTSVSIQPEGPFRFVEQVDFSD